MGNVRTATQNDIQWGNLEADDAARLDSLLAANAATLRKREIFRSDREEFDALAMKRPITPEKAFAYLGLTLGSLGPLSLLLKIAIDSNGFGAEFNLFVGLFLVATAATAAIGF